MDSQDSPIRQIITDTLTYACLDCGKCTVACPLARYDQDYSPRKLVSNAIRDNGELLKDERLWSCLTCSRCEQRCQSGVRFTELIKSLRAVAYTSGNKGECTHGGALQSLMHIMTADHLSQNRLGWLPGNCKTAPRSDTVYFAGCQPYFDILFAGIGVKTLDIARGAIKLLNRLDIVPSLLAGERCCGHDLLWTGDIEGFKKLMVHNMKEIAAAGATRVITTCPECYHTLKFEYPRYSVDSGFEVLHISQLLAANAGNGKLKFHRMAKKVTYHDPCRLGRASGIYDEPRAVIKAVPDLELIEMGQSRKDALCCGTSAWTNCGAVNKQLQAELLRKASSTGAEILLTSCPKCQIHLKCALDDNRLGRELKLNIEDITSFVAKALARKEAE